MREVNIVAPLRKGLYILEVNRNGISYIPFIKTKGPSVLGGTFHDNKNDALVNLYHISNSNVDFNLDEKTLLTGNNLRLFRITEHNLQFHIYEHPELVI